MTLPRQIRVIKRGWLSANNIVFHEGSEATLVDSGYVTHAGQTLALPVRSPAMVFHLIEGGIDVQVEDQRFTLAEADTCCAPGYTGVTLRNARADQPAFVFIADETPLHRKLGVFETRA